MKPLSAKLPLSASADDIDRATAFKLPRGKTASTREVSRALSGLCVIGNALQHETNPHELEVWNIRLKQMITDIVQAGWI